MTDTEKVKFKQELKTDFIPAIERMIEKEKTHLAFLEKSHEKMKGLPLISNFLMNRYAKFSKYTIDDMIAYSEKHLFMLEKRLTEYQDYANH